MIISNNLFTSISGSLLGIIGFGVFLFINYIMINKEAKKINLYKDNPKKSKFFILSYIPISAIALLSITKPALLSTALFSKTFLGSLTFIFTIVGILASTSLYLLSLKEASKQQIMKSTILFKLATLLVYMPLIYFFIETVLFESLVLLVIFGITGGFVGFMNHQNDIKIFRAGIRDESDVSFALFDPKGFSKILNHLFPRK